MNNKKIYLKLYIVITILLITNIIVDGMYQISIAGYWSDRVLFWLWFLSTFFILIVFWKKLITKIYFGILVAGVILSIIPMMVPFFGIILSSTGGGLYFKKQITPKYRVQIVGYGIMSRPFLEVIKNKGILEKRIAHINAEIEINDSTYLSYGEIKDAKLVKETDTNLVIQFSGDKLSGVLSFSKNE